MNEQEYIEQRLEDQQRWYDAKSQQNQLWYKRLKAIEIIAAAMIPLLAGFPELIPQGLLFPESFPLSQLVLGMLGVVIAVCVGISGMNKYQENWLAYRTTAETLKHEKFLYLTKTPPYDSDEAFSQLVSRIESLISKENSQWASVNATKKKN